jgi:hypothetical protein
MNLKEFVKRVSEKLLRCRPYVHTDCHFGSTLLQRIRVNRITSTFREFLKRRNETITGLRRRLGALSLREIRVYLAATATWEIFSATPIGNGLSPVLKAVPNLSSSQDETFSILTPSFAAASNLSA